MAASTVPVKNQAFVFHVALRQQASPLLYQANPTLAIGDVKVQTDDGALADITTLPTGAASSLRVKVSLSAGEMNGDNVWVQFSDAAGAQWCDLTVCLQTSARSIDNLAFPTTSGYSLDVTATGAAGIDLANVENPTTALVLSGTTVKTATDVETDTQDIQARLPAALTGAGNIKADAQVVSDKTGYALTQTFPTNFSTLSIDASGRVDLGAWLGSAPDALSSGKIPADLKLWLTSAPAALSTNGYVQSILLRWLTDNAAGSPAALGTGSAVRANDYAGNAVAPASDTTTILARLGAWTGTGINTILGAFRALMAKATALTGTDLSTGTTFDNTTDSAEALRDRGDAAWITATGFATAADYTSARAAKLDALSETRLAELDAANLPADVAAVQSDTDNIQTRLPAALVGGRMDSDVGNMQANTVNSTSMATDTIGSLELAATAATEIANAVAAVLPGGTPSITGTVVSGIPTATTFVTDLPNTTANYYAGGNELLFTSGLNSTGAGARKITASSGTSGAITIVVSPGFPITPSLTDAFKMMPVSDVLEDVVPGTHASGTAGGVLGLITSGQILTTSPVSQGGDVTIVQGDTYANADNRALDWTEATGSNWPVLTGATIKVFFGHGGGDIVSPSAGYDGSVVTATGSTKKVRLELTAAQTAALAPGVYALNVQATLSSASVITLVTGQVNVQGDVR